MTAHLRAEAGVGAVATGAPGWDAAASLEGKVNRLHDQMQWVFAEIEKARQEARDSVAGLGRWWSSRRMNCGLPSRLTRVGLARDRTQISPFCASTPAHTEETVPVQNGGYVCVRHPRVGHAL